MIDPHIVKWMVNGIWIVWAIVWIVMAFGTKRSTYRQSWFSRWAYLGASAGFCVFWMYCIRWRLQLYPYSITSQMVGVILCAAGIGLAIWSRFILGSNWSGIITLKENHELIRHGPYRFVRHPIYTGFILGVLGSIVAVDPWLGGLAIVVFVLVMLKIKSLQEEKIMIASFPNDYPQYKKEVKSLIPFVI